MEKRTYTTILITTGFMMIITYLKMKKNSLDSSKKLPYKYQEIYFSEIEDKNNNNHPLKIEFENWKRKYNKEYRSKIEEAQRFENFIKSYEKYNNLVNYDNLSFTPELGKFSDLSKEEFESYYLGLRKPKEDEEMITIVDNTKEQLKEEKKEDNLSQSLPEEIDWLKDGALAPIRNQGYCGSCYAFATISIVESFLYIKSKKSSNPRFIQLSEQQILDCSKSYGNLGCLGGYPSQVLLYLQTFGAMNREDYTYNAEGFQECRYSPVLSKQFTSYKKISNNTLEIKKALQKGPVVAGINHAGLLNYKNGIIREDLGGEKCPQDNTHAIVIYGYGKKDGIEVWKVRNSWGRDWGGEGNFMIEIKGGDKGGVCGIEMDVSYIDE